MMKYVKKPIVIEAIQWVGTHKSLEEIDNFCGNSLQDVSMQTKQLKIYTLEGEHIADNGDFIIKGIKDEFYPCKPDIFELTYEKVDS